MACLVAEASFLRVGVDDLDEGCFVQQALRVMHGQIPYRDFQSLYTRAAVTACGVVFGPRRPYVLAPRALSLLSRAALAL